MINKSFFFPPSFLFKHQHFLSLVIKQFILLPITMSIGNLSAMWCQRLKRTCGRDVTAWCCCPSPQPSLCHGCSNATNSSPALTALGCDFPPNRAQTDKIRALNWGSERGRKKNKKRQTIKCSKHFPQKSFLLEGNKLTWKPKDLFSSLQRRCQSHAD